MEREKNRAATGKPLSGWLTIRRQFAPYQSTSSIFLPSTTTPTSTAPPSTSEFLGDSDAHHGGGTDDGSTQDKDGMSLASGTSTPGSATPSNLSTAASLAVPTTYSARIANTYRQVMEARQKRESAPKEYFFCVLKGSVMFLYEDEAQAECVAAITVDKYIVGVENSEGGRFMGKDAEMFAKRNAVVLRISEDREGKAGLPVLVKGIGAEGSKELERELEAAPWFLFSKSNTK